MKKFIGLIICLGLFLTGCSFYYEEGIENIKEPEKTYYALDGQWELSDLKNQSIKSTKNEEVWENIFFKGRTLALGNIYTDNLSYTYKNVDTRDYLLYKHRTTPEFLGIKSDRLDIINLYDGADFITELIKVDENELIYSKGEDFLFYRIKNSHITKKDIDRHISLSTETGVLEASEARGDVGLILGIKSLDDTGERLVFNYRTEYIKINSSEEVEKFEAENILLPRKNGFYKVKVEPRDLFNDNIFIEYLDKDLEMTRTETNYIKNILYIGNDYMSVENIAANKYKNLRVYPIDYLSDEIYRKLEDILDEKSMERVKLDMENSKDKSIREDFKTENFGLRRKNGYWTLFGRVNYNDGDKSSYKDFDIRAVTPKSLVNYDELPILWNAIESEIPSIIDGFISPKKDFIVVRTKETIEIYPIYKGKISNEKLYSTTIGSGEEIIMAEWATNIYVNMWEDYFSEER